MVPKTPNHLNSNSQDVQRKNQLIPERHPQKELFICDVSDAVLKDIMQHMEHPFYSLSKKPETNIRRYEHNGNYIEVIPSVKGLATIYDKDILIYCISQIMHKSARGEPISRRVRVVSRDLLIFTNRGTGGRDYEALQESMERLRGTTIKTNIKAGGEEQTDTFGLIESSSIKRQHGLDGRLLWCEVVLSDWVFNAIEAKEVLKLHRDYFRLRKPIERRIYELARKHCGRQPQWKCSLELLFKKSGSKGELKKFRQAIRNLAKHDHLPEYHTDFNDYEDSVIFRNRGELKPIIEYGAASGETAGHSILPLKADTYEAARRVAQGLDIYALESEWREWAAKGNPLKSPDAAFIGFCRQRAASPSQD